MKIDASTSLSTGNGKLKIMSVEVYNLIGKQQNVNSNFSSTGAVVLDIIHLPAGVYVVKVETENGVVTERVVKK